MGVCAPAMQVTISLGTVEKLSILADRLQVAEVTIACGKYILEMVEDDVESALAMYAQNSIQRLSLPACHEPRQSLLLKFMRKCRTYDAGCSDCRRATWSRR